MRHRRAGAVLASAVVLVTGGRALAVDPNPLENAYWRFEEGTDGVPVDGTVDNTVIDSANANHMRTADANTAPVYSSNVSTPIVPQTGLPNALALQFAGGKDVFSHLKNINNPIINNGFTLEASFKLDSVGGGAYQCIVGKDGKPTGNPVAALELKVRGDDGKLQIELIDDGGAAQQVSSASALAAGQWYHAAAVNDGSTLSLYLDSDDGAGYVLQGQTAVNGALFDFDRPWSIGRGMYNDFPADWVNGGAIEEVRLSNTVLDPSKFLFTPANAKWNVDASGNWSSPGNWQDGIPRVAAATANLTDAITAAQTLAIDVPVTLGTLNFNNTAGYVLNGPESITLYNLANNCAVNVVSGSHVIATPVVLAGDTTFDVGVSGDKLTITGDLAASGRTVSKTGGGTLELKNLRSAALNLNGGAVRITPNSGPAGVSRIDQIVITSGALDISNNKLITQTALGQLNGSAYDGVQGMVQSGRNGGGWAGSGIATSQTTAVSGNFHSIAVATASDVLPATATATALWAGQTITGTDTLVMYTYGGDANLDGKLNIDDYIAIDQGISAGLSGWANGDFNYDGKVNIDDYTTVIDSNIANQNGFVFPTAGGPASAGLSLTSVPEPAGIMLAIGLLALRRRRRNWQGVGGGNTPSAPRAS